MSKNPTEGWPDNIKMNVKIDNSGVDWIHVVKNSRFNRGGLLWML
jgi:hypothetical protein